jgi:DNA gyrase subunit A
MRKPIILVVSLALTLLLIACGNGRRGAIPASGHIEATDVRLSAKAGGKLLMLVTAQGMMIRTSTAGVRRIGRATQGVKLIDIGLEGKVVAVARLAEPEVGEDETEQETMF